MRQLGIRLLTTGLIAASLLALLAALGQDFLTTLFLCRVPVAAAVFLGFLAVAPYGPLAPMLGSLVRLTLPRMMLAAVATTLVTLSLIRATETVLQYGVDRYALDRLDVGIASPHLGQWFWKSGLRFWQGLPAVGLLLSLVLHSPRRQPYSSRAWIVRAAAASAAVGLTVAAVNFLTPRLDAMLRPLAGAQGWIPSAVRVSLGPGYFDPHDGFILPGHLQSTAFLVVASLVYAAGYFLLHPRRRSPAWQRWQRAFPPIYYLLLLTAICVWLLTGVTFLLDHWRIPTLLAVGLFSYLAYRWFLFDHYFTTHRVDAVPPGSEYRSPPADSKSTAATSLPRLPASHQFRFISQPLPESESGRRAFAGPSSDPEDKTPPPLPELRLNNLDPGSSLVVVAACGGGILAGAWTVLALTRLYARFPRLAQATALISAVSGGSLGALYLLDQMLSAEGTAAEKDGPDRSRVDREQRWERANQAIRRSTLDATMWGIAYPGFLRSLLPALIWDRRYDHGWATECGWRQPMIRPDLTLGQAAQAYREGRCPQVILNSVCLENGRRFLFSSGVDQLESEAARQVARFDFFSEYRGRDIPLVTAARMSATFPYISPIARIDCEPARPAYHLADGGYFDNSGVVSAIEWIRWQLDRPDSILKARGIRQVLVIRLSTPSIQPKVPGTRVGWRNAIFGPLLTLMSVRGASQAERAEQELNLFTAWCRQVHDLKFDHIELAYRGAGPLSWELSERDQVELDACWERDYERPLDQIASGQRLDPLNAAHQAVEKLATLWEPPTRVERSRV